LSVSVAVARARGARFYFLQLLCLLCSFICIFCNYWLLEAYWLLQLQLQLQLLQLQLQHCNALLALLAKHAQRRHPPQ
jgi:hypothetical protein